MAAAKKQTVERSPEADRPGARESPRASREGSAHNPRLSVQGSAEPYCSLADFPLNDFAEAARELRRPFTPEAVKFKVQTSNDRGAMIVSYIDARLVVERLNLIVPHLWSDAYEPLDGKHLRCALTVDGITRYDVGEGRDGKSQYSDALKRAAVKFGVGVSLYAIPQVWIPHSSTPDAWLKKTAKNTFITEKGERALRKGYAKWLEETGAQKFGPALDHGDVEFSVGDVEAEPVEANGLVEEPIREELTDERAEVLKGECRDAFDALRGRDGGMLPGAFQAGLRAAWWSHEELERFRDQLRDMAATLEAEGAAA